MKREEMCRDLTQNDLRCAIHMAFDERRLRETYHVQFGVLIFHHAQDAVSMPREVRNTHFVQCADVIYNFKSPLEPFS